MDMRTRIGRRVLVMLLAMGMVAHEAAANPYVAQSDQDETYFAMSADYWTGDAWVPLTYVDDNGGVGAYFDTPLAGFPAEFYFRLDGDNAAIYLHDNALGLASVLVFTAGSASSGFIVSGQLPGGATVESGAGSPVPLSAVPSPGGAAAGIPFLLLGALVRRRSRH